MVNNTHVFGFKHSTHCDHSNWEVILKRIYYSNRSLIIVIMAHSPVARSKSVQSCATSAEIQPSAL